MFDPTDGGRWELLNISNKRHIDSVFLPADTKAELVDRVTSFVTPETKAEYARFNVPFKMNVLLHGLPGTGKTSCIHALASTIDSDIGIIHFSRELTDGLFTKAINSLSNLGNCRVIILEDIDSLFSDERKAHDTTRNNVTMSGLLNCLDGLARNEGILLFMTTNDRKVLKDVAFTRSCRIDLDVEFKEATTDQVLAMIQYYFPDQAAAKSKEALIRPFDLPGMTTAALQTFFFLHRKCADVTVLGKEFRKFLAVGEDVEERPSMYM
jgi:chaperone BCS1